MGELYLSLIGVAMNIVNLSGSMFHNLSSELFATMYFTICATSLTVCVVS